MNRTAIPAALAACFLFAAGLALAQDAPSKPSESAQTALQLLPGQEFFYGRINHMPKGGLTGAWEIAGRVVLVTDKTLLDDKKRPFKVGHRVDVVGKTAGDEFLAESVKKR